MIMFEHFPLLYGKGSFVYRDFEFMMYMYFNFSHYHFLYFEKKTPICYLLV